MKFFIFTSGIRRITIIANDIAEAKQTLVEFEESAWTDKTWNWRIETKGKAKI